ncbi:AAA family ATPase [Pseudolactococcus yaeyamensis]
MTGLRVENLTTDIFENLSFEMPSTGLYGLIGRNGIGKSTLFSLLNGEMKFSVGKLEVGKLAYVPSLEIFDKYLTANDYLKLLASEEQAVFRQNLERLGGADFFNQKIGKYSLGMKELFAFLYILSIESDVLILDELLDGLDEQRRFAAYRLLKKHSHEKLILLTSHNLSEVFDTTDRVYILEKTALKVIDNLETAQAQISF